MHIISSQQQHAVSYQYQRQETTLTASAPLIAPATEPPKNEAPPTSEQPTEPTIDALLVNENKREHVTASLADDALALTNNLFLRIAALILEKITGHAIETIDHDAFEIDPSQNPIETPSEAPPPEQLNLSMVHVAESESLHYQSSGSVTTADGREIQFNYRMQMARQFESFSLSAGIGKPTDPLLFVRPASAPTLNPPSAPQDSPVALPQTASGSGYLIQDHDGDGQFSGKEELIGGLSGNAFGDLSAMDEDGNGFIDEGDTAFFNIYIYEPGKPLQSLQQAGVGALSLSTQATPYHYKQGDDTYARMVASSAALMEDGRVAGLHQIDLFS